LEALQFIDINCPQMLGVGMGLCGKPVSVTVVDLKNLVCDRFLVGTCTDGHKQMSAIIDE
ncbi:MAG: hypothetical protein Q8Q41_04160, partial [bacterium]|nr:hypothetical protein [bacterium]